MGRSWIRLKLGACMMSVSTSQSFLLSSILSVMLFAGMQLYKTQLASAEYLTIVGGLLASFLFILTLTAVGNLENCLFGHQFQAKLFPEVVLCLGIALFFCRFGTPGVCDDVFYFLSGGTLLYQQNIHADLHCADSIATKIKQNKNKRS